MKAWPGSLVVAVLASTSALAQAAPEATAAGVPPPAPLEAPALSSCQLVDHRGVEPGDAATAARLVCSEIVQAGPPAGARYRVAFGSLGSLIILSVDRDGEAPGSTADSRSITLHGIEEVRIAAPRIADAIVHGAPLADTQTVDNIVDEEARVPRSRPGKLHFAAGVAGAFTPFQEGLGVAPALVLDLHYGMSQLEIGGSLRFGAGSSGSTSSPRGNLAAASVGARYFTSNKEISPYFGGGLSYSYFSVTLPGGFDGNNSGLGAYGDAGVEILRTHHAHLALGVRLDLPFFVLNDQSTGTSAVAPGVTAPSRPGTMYFAPVSLEARLTF
jgi:hypothetical protein